MGMPGATNSYIELADAWAERWAPMRRTILLSGMLSLVMGFVGTLLAQAVVLPGLVGAQEARIRAEQVTIVGDTGAERIRLETGPGVRSSTTVLDANGHRRVELATGGSPAGGASCPRAPA